MIRRLLREPLVHFLLLGALLFAAWGGLNRGGFAARDEIVVSRSQADGLAMQFERVWQRPPTPEEHRVLIDNWVRDEIFYREAVAMGLDQDDPIVRRRLSQKLQFIIDGGAPAAPTDTELQAHLDANADRYRLPPSYALRQAYFDPSSHGERLTEAVDAARRALAAGATSAGDPTMLPARLEGDATEVARQFGEEFELALRALPVGSWTGPVGSGFGLHLVLLERRDDGRPAALADVRAEVARDLMDARAQAAKDAHYERLRSKYAVRVETADSTAAPAG